jgi:hypothetical protein
MQEVARQAIQEYVEDRSLAAVVSRPALRRP